jgi:hypothetical protein
MEFLRHRLKAHNLVEAATAAQADMGLPHRRELREGPTAAPDPQPQERLPQRLLVWVHEKVRGQDVE